MRMTIGVNEDTNLSRLGPDSVRASTKEDSQRTTTLTDNKKRDYENEGSTMHEDSCTGINYAHMFPKRFTSLHTLLGFTLYFVSSIQILSLYPFIQFLTCTQIPCRDSHCENGCCPYTPRRLQQTADSCKRSNCNKIENNENNFMKVVRLRFIQRRNTMGFSVLSCRFACILIYRLSLNCCELHQESLHLSPTGGRTR